RTRRRRRRATREPPTAFPARVTTRQVSERSGDVPPDVDPAAEPHAARGRRTGGPERDGYAVPERQVQRVVERTRDAYRGGADEERGGADAGAGRPPVERSGATDGEEERDPRQEAEEADASEAAELLERDRLRAVDRGVAEQRGRDRQHEEPNAD